MYTATRYSCLSIPRRGRTRALTMPLVADIGWLMEKFSPQRKLWCTLVSPFAARNRSRSPSLFRVYLMWIAQARATVAWDSSPLAGQGQFETLPATPGKGSNLGGDTTRIVQVCLTDRARSVFKFRIVSVVVHQPSGIRAGIKASLRGFAIDDRIEWRAKSFLFCDIPDKTEASLNPWKIFLMTNMLLKECNARTKDLKIISDSLENH